MYWGAQLNWNSPVAWPKVKILTSGTNRPGDFSLQEFTVHISACHAVAWGIGQGNGSILQRVGDQSFRWQRDCLVIGSCRYMGLWHAMACCNFPLAYVSKEQTKQHKSSNHHQMFNQTHFPLGCPVHQIAKMFQLDPGNR